MALSSNGSPATGRLKAHDRRKAITKAAHRLFVEKGFDTTRMEDIAEAAGCTTGPLYHVFSSKKEVFEAVIVNATEALQARIASARKAKHDLSPVSRILFDCDHLLDVAASPDTYMLTRDAPRILGDERGRELRDGQMLRHFEADLREAMIEGEIEPEPPAPLSAILGAIIVEGVYQATQSPRSQLESYRNAVRRLVLRLRQPAPSG